MVQKGEKEPEWEQGPQEQQQAEQPGGEGEEGQDREGEPDTTQVCTYVYIRAVGTDRKSFKNATKKITVKIVKF